MCTSSDVPSKAYVLLTIHIKPTHQLSTTKIMKVTFGLTDPVESIYRQNSISFYIIAAMQLT